LLKLREIQTSFPRPGAAATGEQIADGVEWIPQLRYKMTAEQLAKLDRKK
jgi:hypothetical protein